MLILVGPMDNVSSLLAALGCGIPSLPTSYLDLPMGVASKTKLVEDHVQKGITLGSVFLSLLAPDLVYIWRNSALLSLADSEGE